jgi:heme-degrading monooxygenase HmoA
MTDIDESSVVVDAWTVEDGSQEEFLDTLVALFERVRELDGFLEGAIFRGADKTRFISWARMRSPRERDAAMIDSQVRARVRSISGIAHPDLGAYTMLRTFSPPES